MTRGYAERLFVIDCGDPRTCSELMDRLSEEVSMRADVFGFIRGGKIYLRVVGFEPDVVRTVLRIREAVKLIRRRSESARSGILVEELSRLVKGPVVPEVVVELLKLNGIKAELRGNIIYADMSVTELAEVAKMVSEALTRLERIDVPANVKKVLIMVGAITGQRPPSLLRRLEELGLLGDSGELIVPWTEAARRLIEDQGFDVSAEH
ncbi:MAG: hypothetical protein DRO12_00750 [Thermoprotei archaeon]|nr:MAG: hypothetical protein DRO12_00750 [Thermoprotei archaeon]